MSVNQDLADLQIRHAVDLRRFTQGELAALLEVLEKADARTVATIRRRYGPNMSQKSLRRLLKELNTRRAGVYVDVQGRVRRTGQSLSTLEAATQDRLVNAAVGVDLGLKVPPARQLRQLVTGVPYQGRLMREWFASLRQADRRRLNDTLQQGLVEGRSVDHVARQLAGTRSQGFTNGVLAISRNQAEAVVRTTYNHATNSANELFFNENADVVTGLKWTATLDGRTTAICRANDGKVRPMKGKSLPRGVQRVPKGLTLPAHVNERSIWTTVLDGVAVAGRRPFVSAEDVGTVPARQNYQTWLSNQPAAFQDEVLGDTKGALFRRGGLKLDQFIDRSGNELTIDQLAARDPAAFEAANLVTS